MFALLFTIIELKNRSDYSFSNRNDYSILPIVDKRKQYYLLHLQEHHCNFKFCEIHDKICYPCGLS